MSADRGTRVLSYLADVTVNQPNGAGATRARPDAQAASRRPRRRPPADGSRQRLAELGPERFAAALRAQSALAVTDTTFRDAHQSLLATRVRTRDLVADRTGRLPDDAAAAVDRGVGRRDLRRRPAVPVRGSVGTARRPPRRGAEHLPADAAARPQHRGLHAVPGGGDLGIRRRGGAHRHRHLPDLRRAERRRADAAGHRRRAARPARRSPRSRSATPATCPTRPRQLYTLDYYLRLADRIVDAGAHVLAIKDMAGLLRAPAASTLVSALRSRFDLPVHLHTHDTAGGQLATYLAASAAGVDAVDAASAPMAGTTSQPPMSALVAATDFTERATGLQLRAVEDLEPYWEAVRAVYRPFESGLTAPTGRVYKHEIPGGQLSNLRQQAIALGLGNRFEAIEDMYAAADRMLGHLVKVTPSSKVVGDLALHLVGSGVAPGRLRGQPGQVRRPGLGDRLPVRRTRRPAGRLAGAVPDPRPWPGRTVRPVGRRSVRRRRRRAGRRAAPHAEPAAVPRPDEGVRAGQARPTGTCPCCTPATTCTGCVAASSTRSTWSPACSSTWAWRRSAMPTSVACGPSSRR